jgi:glycerophosphoryl diester phosphodiesterase
VELVTDGVGAVEDMSATELAALSVEGSDCGIPLLTEVLNEIPPEVDVNVDVKEVGVAADLLDVLADAENDVVVSSFHPDPLWRTRIRDESIPLAFNVGVRPDANFLTAEVIDCEYVNAHWSLCLSTDVVESAHEPGMEVHAWPVGSRTLAWTLVRQGVDGLIATKPL